MTGQAEFMEAIRELERIAQTNGNRLSMGEIRDYFSDYKLDGTQYDFICKYYEARNITISDRRAGEETDITEEEIETRADPLDEEMVSRYRKETGTLSTLSEDQVERIARKLTSGDGNARNLLIEANLSLAMKIAGEYKGKGMAMSDLIQESNIGLLVAVNDYEPEFHGRFGTYVEQMIRRQIEEALDEYNHSTRSAMKIASRVNELTAVATAFAREYEREATPHELAQRLGIPEEQVRELMKVSLDAIAVLDGAKIGK
ncbi:MAG: sigma-70 family RNA polymerase sigma factor [Eubacterium sp.]|nr:sigma-70 family RNA polymerase sigma factor [Eubacterium sp.]